MCVLGHCLLAASITLNHNQIAVGKRPRLEISHINSAFRFRLRQTMRPKPLLEKQRQTLSLIGCTWQFTRPFFSGKFQSSSLTQFRRMVVSSEKTTWFQSIALWSCAYFKRFIGWFSVSNAFDKGRLYFASVSFKRRFTVLSLLLACFLFTWFVMSRLVTNVCCSASETICWSYFEVVARGRPIRSDSLKFFHCFHRLSKYCTVNVVHLTALATNLWQSFGPNGCWDRKLISYRWRTDKAIVQC